MEKGCNFFKWLNDEIVYEIDFKSKEIFFKLKNEVVDTQKDDGKCQRWLRF